MTHVSAIELYQRHLDPLSKAIIEGDLTRFVAGMSVPHVLRTVDSHIRIESQDALKTGAAQYLHAIREKGITRIDRLCKSAIFLSETEIEGFNSVRAYHGNEPAILPFLARMKLEFREGAWRVSETDMAILRAQWDVLPDFDKGGANAETASQDENSFNLSCFQLFLNWLSQAALCNDFDAWLRACALPLTVTSGQGTTVFETEDALRREFDYYMVSFKAHNVTQIIREPLDVTLEGENRMVGRCRTFVLSQANLVVEPYESTITIERLRKGFWQLSRMDNVIGHRDWHKNRPLS
ncbi:hypothetical protein TRP8649_03266 [Pelagimonas phthalicica]|uniref:Uncharacterized protein n=1 Tax=Pelagimonas phthalicica TaxID=1037362 RepID=A0A238JG13_9RHOB|nr:hypothetical protein [Pelagimonas phthalicica]TDS92084.1 hypothetical protein CLV87_3266 [Pelagimonas phthalicica]SMX29134.1 hypothetical protein TRP8649_03266 [Pelagimonas phthalicica]